MEQLKQTPFPDFAGRRGIAPAVELLTTEQVAEVTGHVPGTIRNLRMEGVLKCEVYGRDLFFLRESVNAYMANRRRA